MTIFVFNKVAIDSYSQEIKALHFSDYVREAGRLIAVIYKLKDIS